MTVRNRNKKLLLDLGSSTVKVFASENGRISHIKSISLPLKNEFDAEKGLSRENRQRLYALIRDLKEEFPEHKVKNYATAIYRKLSPRAQEELRDEFFCETQIFLNIIEHELENYYLETALVDRYRGGGSVLLINIGGGSTELVLVENSKTVLRQNIDLGVSGINSQFPGINNALFSGEIKAIKDFILALLPPLGRKVPTAFHTGGELTYMKLAGYALRNNHLFEDADHPYLVDFEDFADRNGEIFYRVSLESLESLMPENPAWMHGARACSLLAQAICEKYGVEKLIPSDSNLVHGADRREFRRVTLSGSFRKHLPYILGIKKELEVTGTEVLSPRFVEPKNPGEEFVVFSGEEGSSPLELERHHLDSIAASDALIVCDPQGYVGASALIEIGYAQSLGKRIIFTEEPQEFMLNTLPREVGI
ncbi:MAG: hypothetical protein M1352_00520 [Patescibacteria group bacterium]|nr:hypothetical protein [Patescibacteria group bacterium]